VSLLVVPLGSEETHLLTLGEWEQLLACEGVMFERADHPLIEKLVAAGVRAGAFDDEPGAGRSGWAFVAEPDSSRVVELAKAGARVSPGPAVSPDDLSAAHGAGIVRRAGASAASLAVIMARLRSADGCPWDREQDHSSLTVHLLEEAHEVIDAIERGEEGVQLEEELGDLLLQVFFHAQMAADDSRFDVSGVGDAIVAKLIRRHPHVFGDTIAGSASEVVHNWEAIKSKEKKRGDLFDDIPRSLPALTSAYKTQKRASSLGWSPEEADAVAQAQSALKEGDLGSALFWTVAAARAGGTDPEGALRRATRSFVESQPPGAPPGG
jgi:XTP/dITP diphosphohydrolase